ncbi:MAG TPA: DUF3018 family protein [Piscirickettsiaceae bacterium]|nr:DUF3018 family protein [Piscirickettsiaceae bacterium]
MTSVVDRVRRYREKMRKAGYRQVQIWVPDTRNPAFIEACRQQARSLKADTVERETLEWMAQVQDYSGWA